jgi:hypothetical protein
MTDRWDEELDRALDALRADVPEMDQHAFAAGRARLRAAIGSSPDDRHVPEPDEVAPLVLSPDRSRRSPPLRKAAPWLAVAAAVAAVAVGAVAFLPGDPAPRAGGSVATAAPKPTPTAPAGESVAGRPGDPLPAMPDRPLNTAGELAGAAHDVPLKPGQVRYVRTTSTQAASSEEPGGSQTIELWIPHDRESEWLCRRTASGDIQGRSEKGFEESRANGGRFEHDGALWPQDPAVIARLPKDPEALYAWVRNQVNADLPSGTTSTMTAAQQAVHEVTSLLNDMTGTVPADLRAALLGVLGYLPGITVTPGAKAPDGRTAVALGSVSDDGSYRNELLLAADTAQVVEMRNVVLKPFQGYERNQVFTSGLRTEAVVSELGERP